MAFTFCLSLKAASNHEKSVVRGGKRRVSIWVKCNVQLTPVTGQSRVCLYTGRSWLLVRCVTLQSSELQGRLSE
ncbi:hypothetical protein PISMIDRAFT_438833 [Pisolithus microcarpus 441]|uniref:Uncharacterized protein n=1 Tax=Pisolithus microcarpus 441 TaxID=765257 RepID=A0A0D0A5K0_9AGAM|nr:hypothetical protein BKA83DRAFT_438833 [Pisolithus microcarpus]KIK29692.1 hypothetical protein PISMIDRAFT_438833 [Pisolithus microcarpus 441]